MQRLKDLFAGSVRARLAFGFFAITTGAVAFVYLYVVPQLSDSLTAEKLRLLQVAATEQAGPRLEAAVDEGLDQRGYSSLVREIGRATDSRVTLLGTPPDSVGSERSWFVIADSEFEFDALLPSYVAADAALTAGTVRSGVESIDGRRFGESAIVISRAGSPIWAGVLSLSLDDVDANVALIKRQILIAGAIAILASLMAGWFAARNHARRLRRLERAALEVAEGRFGVEIPIDSNDEVGQLARSLDEMQTELGRLDSARREFIANASHELRTPIFSLGGFMELLTEDDPDPESRAQFLDAMRGQVERLSKLTVDLLNLSKLDSGAMEVELAPVDLGEIAAAAVREFEPAFERHGVKPKLELEGHGGAQVWADPERTIQVLRILIDNAITHTPEETEISIQTFCDDGNGRLAVIDAGPGISPDQASQVFNRFHTGDSVSGSGLGLAIGRELTERMGGTLELTASPGRTTFSLEFPAVEPIESVGASR